MINTEVRTATTAYAIAPDGTRWRFDNYRSYFRYAREERERLAPQIEPRSLAVEMAEFEKVGGMLE